MPGAQNWPLKLADLPDEVVTRLKRADAKYADKLKNVEGRWPQFAAQVAQIIDRKDLRQDLWPTRHAHLSQPMRTFLDKELREAATASEWDQLQNAEGHWPAYPQTIQELAKKYYLSVPWQSLPPSFSPDFYEKYRIRKGALNENPGAGLLD